MLEYLNKLINKNDPEQLHLFTGLGGFIVISVIALILTIALVMGKSVGAEFGTTLTILAGYSGYLVKKGSE